MTEGTSTWCVTTLQTPGLPATCRQFLAALQGKQAPLKEREGGGDGSSQASS